MFADSGFMVFCYILIQKMKKKQVIPGRTIPASMHTYEFLDKDSMIQCEEIRAVSKARLDANRGCIGTLTPEDFDLVKGKFKRAYNL